ncbi:zinc finger protein 668-like isoform X12 [Zerene cesonia]|uniref:zinc finger protein 668-like isoform X12 n=1 Tax=Zerene cesonia TaxID=33412 RepID=UPI0018E58D5D|nr:zinc finger protein 668-like isoform X12 [Zerene cesonia]
MDGKTTEWRPGPTVCRCCLSEGCYKDISTEYFWMGKREVYAEMLLETFDLTISYAQSGTPNSHSRLICEPCISRLRDAADFKRQVKECEQTFLQCFNPISSVDIEIPMDITDKEPVKVEKVKQEKENSYDDDDYGDAPEFLDDDDDLDDQPLMNLATKVPKKETVDVMDLLDNAKAVKRKSSKAKTSPAKRKAKEAKPAASKAKPEKKKKAETEDPVRNNATIIIRHTTAYPFRVNDKCILCVYCHELYENPDEFRHHMTDEHKTFSIRVAFHNLPKMEFIKADLTNLRCRICSETFEDIESIASHLKAAHNMGIDLNAKFGVMPYRLLKDTFICAVCYKSVPSLLHLNRHTITHFLTYVCHVCGKSYVATTGLLRHVRSKHQQYEVSCKRCGRVFPTMEAKDKHCRTDKACMRYSCAKCPERFQNWKARLQHMQSQHGNAKRANRCADCNMSFPSGAAYYEHFRLQHSSDCLMCKHCGLKFVNRSRLERHLTKHF